MAIFSLRQVFNRAFSPSRNKVLVDAEFTSAQPISGAVTVSNRVAVDTVYPLDKRVEVVSSILSYEGEAAPGSALSAAAWRIKRVTVQGFTTVTEWASSAFDKVWNSRATYFSGVPFINLFSTIFDGVNDYATVAHSSTLDFERTNTFSIIAWFKTSRSGATMCILSKQSGTGTGYAVRLTSAGAITFELRNAVGNRIFVTTNTTGRNDGLWHSVLVTYSGSSAASGVKVYVDGANQTLTVNNDTLTLSTLNTNALNIAGNTAGTGESFTGHIDEVCIWDVELSAANATALYNSGTPIDLDTGPSNASRRSWWRMGDNDTFPTLDDAVGANNATMVNMTAGDIETEVAP